MKHVCPFRRTLLAAAVAVCAAMIGIRNTSWLAEIFSNLDSRTGSHSIATPQPDVTAVLLNWVRLDNVVQIVSNLCGPSLDGVIKEIVIWNNNYNRPLSDEDFANCTCPKLRIHNSPENLYFQARFIACVEASTPYCFIQDDDYLVKPEIIRSLRARINTHDIFHLPPDEVLSSFVLSIDSPNITFGFSWLGYGALLLRSNAESFLSLLKRVGASAEETKMADNYYAILKNSFPEVWTGHPIPLFGGGDFTVGEEGVARNRKHIAAATSYLDRIVTDYLTADAVSWPYVSLPPSPLSFRLERSPCIERLCMLESTIKFLPDSFATAAATERLAVELFSREARLSSALTDEFASNYVEHSLFRAVDADPTTLFRSFQDATEGDTLELDILNSVQQLNWTGVEWSWLVASDMTPVLKGSKFSFSADRSTWVQSAGSVSCKPYSAQHVTSSSDLKCGVSMEGPTLSSARYFRIQLEKVFTVPWRIYETWVTESSPDVDFY